MRCCGKWAWRSKRASVQDDCTAAKHASDKAPVRSGDLRDSIEVKGVEREGDDVVGYWGSDLPYALPVELLHPSKRGFLRGGADAEYGKLVGEIVRWLA